MIKISILIRGRPVVGRLYISDFIKMLGLDLLRLRIELKIEGQRVFHFSLICHGGYRVLTALLWLANLDQSQRELRIVANSDR